jgi:hypothetical protein
MKNLAFWIGAAVLICGVVAIASGAGDEGRMPDLDGAVAWLNSTPLSNKSLRGKVVLVNFWTYSCINSLRELPSGRGRQSTRMPAWLSLASIRLSSASRKIRRT